MTTDKTSCKDTENSRESDFIVITDDNKEDVIEFCLIYLDGLCREITNQQNSKISLGKMLLAYDDRKLKAQGNSLLLESTQLGRRYKEIKKAQAKLETDMTIDEVSYLFENIEQFLNK